MASNVGSSYEEMAAEYRTWSIDLSRAKITRDLQDAMKQFDEKIGPHWAQIGVHLMEAQKRVAGILKAFEVGAGHELAEAVTNFDLQTTMPSSFWDIFRGTQDMNDFIDLQMAGLEPDRYELKMAELQAARDKKLQHGRSLRPGAAQALPSPASEATQIFSPATGESAQELSPSASLIGIPTLAGNANRTAGNTAYSEANQTTGIYDPESLPTTKMPQTKKRGFSSDGEPASSSKRTRTEPSPISALTPLVVSDICRKEAVAATAPVLAAPSIKIENEPVDTFDIEGSEFVFEYPAAGKGWFVIRCDMGLDAHTPDLGGPGDGGFVTHPFEDNTALKHYSLNTCPGHRPLYDEKAIMREYGHRVVGSDLDENWVSRSNYMLAARVAQKQNAIPPLRKLKHPELGIANRTGMSPNATKQRMKKSGGSAPRG